MDYLERFQQSIDYIEENLKNRITVEELAAQAGFSPYHYYRLFNAYVGMPVMEYIRRRRMAHAASELSINKRIIDIAMDYGFDTHNGFGKSFRKEYGCSPEQFRIHATGHIPEKIELTALRKYNLRGGIVMEPRIITKPSFKVAGFALKTTVAEGQNLRDIPAFWSKFEADGLEERLYNEIKPKRHGEYGVCFSLNMETGNYTFVLGVEADGCDNIPEDMFLGEVPEATYAVFTTPPADYADEGFVTAIQGTWKYIYESWFPKSGYEFAPGKVDFEFYDERCHCEKGAVMDIYIPIVSRK